MPNLENAITCLLCPISNPWAPLGGNNPKKLFPNFKKMNPFWTTYIPRLIFSFSWTRLYKEMSVLNISSSFCCSATQSCPTLCHPMDCSTPGFPIHHQLLELAQIHVHWVGDAIQPSHPLSSPSTSNFPNIRVFSNKLALHIRWPKYWSFSFSISPSNEYSGLISFRMDWLDLLAVQGTLKSSLTPQFKSNSLVLSFLHSPTLTSIHDHWKNHSFD